MSRALSSILVGKIRRENRTERVRIISGPIYRSWNGSWGRRRSGCATEERGRGGRQEDAKRAGCRPRSTSGRCAFLAQGRAGQTKDPRILLANGISSRRPTNSNDAKPDGFRRRANFSNEWSSRCTRDRRTRSAMEFQAIVCLGWLHRLPRRMAVTVRDHPDI